MFLRWKNIDGWNACPDGLLVKRVSFCTTAHLPPFLGVKIFATRLTLTMTKYFPQRLIPHLSLSEEQNLRTTVDKDLGKTATNESEVSKSSLKAIHYKPVQVLSGFFLT
jgi:hypothetical protein